MAIQINGKKVVHLGSATIPIIKGDKGDTGKKGDKGDTGNAGKDGYTPQRGIDYYTPEDKEAIVAEVKEEYEGRIADLEEQVEMLESEFEEKTTLDSESVVISNGLAKSKVAIKGNGNSYQETTEGYNLINITSLKNVDLNGLTVVLNEDKSITINGTATKNYISFFEIDITDLLEDGQTYTITSNNTNGNKNIYSQVTAKKTDGTAVYINVENKYREIKVDKTNYDKYIFIIQGGAINGITFTNYVEKTMLYKGTYDENKPYEPYTNGASPNTEYEQDIEVIDTGWNIFNGILENGTFSKGEKIEVLNSVRTKDFIKIKPNTNYALSVNGVLNRVVVSIYDKDKKFITTDGDNGLVSESGLFTTYANAQYLKFRCYNADKTLFETGKVQLNEGGLLPYLPYGHIGLVQRGIQLIDFGNPTNKVGDVNYTFENDVLTIDLKAGGVYQSVQYNIKDIYKENSGKHLIWNREKIETTGTVLPYALLTVTYTDGTATRYIAIGTDGFLIPENTANVKTAIFNILPNNSNDTTRKGTVIITKPLLSVKEDNPNALYEPYIEPIVREIDLAGEKLAKVGEIKDLLNIGMNGSVKIGDKVIKRYVFTGNEAFTKETTNTGFRFYVDNLFNSTYPKNNDTKWNALCNYFKSINPNESYLSKEGITHGLNKYRLYICAEQFETVTELKNWLKEKYDSGEPLYIDYELAEPQTIELPSISPITLFEGTNIFELVTNLGTTLAVTYKVSNKKKILNLEERISALESAVIGG